MLNHIRLIVVPKLADDLRLAFYRKEKYLYVPVTEYPLKFFNGRRKLASVLSRQPKIHGAIQEKYGSKYQVVRVYYADMKDIVDVFDINNIVFSV